MDLLTVAKTVMDHQKVIPEELPRYLFTDTAKDYPLDDEEDRILAHYNEDSLFAIKTVRFLKDFSRLRAGVDIETTNTSFLRTAELFKQMDVKNYYFHLQLNNPMLKGVDPFAEDLPEELQFMVMNECNNNIWYILREVIKIDGRRFIGNRAVLSFIWNCLNHINTLILLPRQSGKESWNSSTVKTPGGWKFIGELEPGDVIIAPDGSETTVNAVYPQGNKPVFEIRFEDDGRHEAGAEHLWKVHDPKTNNWSVKNTLWCLDRQADLALEGSQRLSIPVVVPEDGNEKFFILPPYSLGKKLGGIKIQPENAIRPTRQDRYLKQMTLLGRTDDSYFIPNAYKQTPSKTQRIAVLQGLMDKLGVIHDDGRITLNVASSSLAKDVQYLARSLGFVPLIDIVSDEGDVTSTITFKGHDRHTLFTLPEKVKAAEAADVRMPFDGKRYIRSFRLLEERKECTCIEVDHPDHLYVTDDFIVTHNTVGMQVLIFILQYIIGRGYKSGLITLASSNRQQFVNAVKKIRSGVPEYLLRMSYLDKDSGNLMTYQGHGVDKMNIFEIRVPSGGEDGAENVSRGSTFGALLLDEPAWMKWIGNIISGSGPSTLTEQKNMLEKGMPWFKAQATTPNSILKEEGRYMYEVYKTSTEWRENYFDSYSESHLFDRIIKACPVTTTFPRISLQYNHLQLGFGEDWVKVTMDKLQLSWAKAKIDLLMMWTEEGKNKILDDKTRELLNDSKREHVRHQEINKSGLFIDWFITGRELRDYINDETEFFTIGVDTSDAKGEGGDSCTITIRRSKTGETVGTGRYSIAYLGDVRDVILEILVNVTNSVLIIERNRAQQIIDDLLVMLPAKGIDPFERIYNEIYQNPVAHATEFRDIQQTKFAARTRDFYLRYKAKFGFHTGASSRSELYGLIYEAVNNTGASCRYGLLVDELCGLKNGPNGRIDHEIKGHDDIVISWLLTYWFLKRGYNKALYKMPSGALLIELKTLAESKGDVKYTPEQLEKFIKIKAQIAELTKRLLSCDSDLIAPRIELDIKKLGAQLPTEMKRLITIDEVIEKAKEDRIKRRIERKRRAMT